MTDDILSGYTNFFTHYRPVILCATVPESVGRALVYAVTLGQVRCEDRLAEIIGVAFLVLVGVTVVLARGRLRKTQASEIGQFHDGTILVLSQPLPAMSRTLFSMVSREKCGLTA